MERDDYEKVLKDFMKLHLAHGKKMTVITVMNPETLGKTVAELVESLTRLAGVGFLIVLAHGPSGDSGN